MNLIKIYFGVFLTVSYLCLGLVQLAAIYAYFVDHLDWWFFFAWPVAMILAYIPIVGSVVGIFAAHKVWGWTLVGAGLLFLWPLALYLLSWLAAVPISAILLITELNFVQLLLKKWSARPVWIKWALYFPVIMSLYLGPVLLFGLISLAILYSTGSTPRGSVFLVLSSFAIPSLSTVCLFWGSFHFAPNSRKKSGLFVFILWSVYFLFSTVLLLDGKTIFGASLPPSLVESWLIRNIACWGSGLFSAIYFSRKIDCIKER